MSFVEFICNQEALLTYIHIFNKVHSILSVCGPSIYLTPGLISGMCLMSWIHCILFSWPCPRLVIDCVEMLIRGSESTALSLSLCNSHHSASQYSTFYCEWIEWLWRLFRITSCWRMCIHSLICAVSGQSTDITHYRWRKYQLQLQWELAGKVHGGGK